MSQGQAGRGVGSFVGKLGTAYLTGDASGAISFLGGGTGELNGPQAGAGGGIGDALVGSLMSGFNEKNKKEAALAEAELIEALLELVEMQQQAGGL